MVLIIKESNTYCVLQAIYKDKQKKGIYGGKTN